MALGPSVAAVSNAYIPNWEASGRLTTGFSRNPARFAVARYAQYVRSPKLQGYYLKFTNQEASRVLDTDRYTWPDANPRPQPKDHESFIFKPFTAERFCYPYGVGNLTMQMADFNIQEVERATQAQKAMTARTMRSASVLTTTANWTAATDGDLQADHTATATALAGGKFDVGSSTSPYLQIGLNAVASQITLDTQGAVENDPARFMVIINPNSARRWGKSPEIKDYIKSSPDAWAQVTGNLHPNTRYGLPSQIYGYEIVIELTVQTTSLKGAAALARSYVWPDSVAAVVSRDGELEGVYGHGNFSTFSMFYYTDGTGAGVGGMDLVTEEFDDPMNKMWSGSVLEHTEEILTCPASGYLITACDA